MSALDVTPWGERWDALAEVVLNDPSAPPVLQLAAVRFRMLGDDSELRSLVAQAVALHESDQSNEPHGTSGMGAPHGPSTRKEG